MPLTPTSPNSRWSYDQSDKLHMSEAVDDVGVFVFMIVINPIAPLLASHNPAMAYISLIADMSRQMVAHYVLLLFICSNTAVALNAMQS